MTPKVPKYKKPKLNRTKQRIQEQNRIMTIVVFPNNKPWVTKDLKITINMKKKMLFSGDPQERKVASRDVRTEIAKDKKINTGIK